MGSLQPSIGQLKLNLIERLVKYAVDLGFRKHATLVIFVQLLAGVRERMILLNLIMRII